MSNHQTADFVRAADARRELGFSNSHFYALTRQGLLPPTFRTGKRAKCMLRHELVEIKAAMAQGKSDEEIRELVSTLIANRQQAAA